MRNPIVDEVQEIRQRLIKQHGGIEGYVKHLQEFEKTLPAGKLVTRPLVKAKRTTLEAKKTTKSKAKIVKTAKPKRSAKRKAV